MMPTLQQVYDNMTVFLRSLGNELRRSPMNSLTPFPIIGGTGKEELLFVFKAESEFYRDLVDYHQGTIHVSMYEESGALIFRFDVQGMFFESKIAKDKIASFLRILHGQEFITLVAVDHLTLRVVWLTNTLHFASAKENYRHFFEKHNVG